MPSLITQKSLFYFHMENFGKQRIADFEMDPNYINVNHGSYGYTPKVVLDEQRKYRNQCEFNTQKWFRRDSEILYNQARAYVASKIKCPANNVYLVQNATDAINCLAKSLKWAEGDVVLLPNTAYSSIRKTINVLRDRYNITIVDINFTAEDMQSEETYQVKVEDFVNGYPKKIKLAVFDHIISVPGFIVPVDALVEFFKQKNIPLFIDGAHAMNQVVVNMSILQPDAYFSNFHKWSFSPKSTAFLYLSDKYVNVVKPAITGNFLGEGPAREYYWTGTRDLTAHFCIKKGLEYSQSFGLDAVRLYNHNLVWAAGKRVAQIWGTNMLNNDPRTVGSMVNVEAPDKDFKVCWPIALEMMQTENCFPHIVNFNDRAYIRLSAQIYNDLSDYQKMAKTFLIYLAKHKKQANNQKK